MAPPVSPLSREHNTGHPKSHKRRQDRDIRYRYLSISGCFGLSDILNVKTSISAIEASESKRVDVHFCVSYESSIELDHTTANPWPLAEGRKLLSTRSEMRQLVFVQLNLVRGRDHI